MREEHPGARSAGGGEAYRRNPAQSPPRGGMTAITTRETLIRCARMAQEKKAVGIRSLDVRESASFTDYFLICSGTSDRQVTTIAGPIQETLPKEGGRA